MENDWKTESAVLPKTYCIVKYEAPNKPEISDYLSFPPLLNDSIFTFTTIKWEKKSSKSFWVCRDYRGFTREYGMLPPPHCFKEI